jgi:hypothetical protein
MPAPSGQFVIASARKATLPDVVTWPGLVKSVSFEQERKLFEAMR